MRRTDVFAKSIDTLADVKGRARVLVRIERLSMGHAGDVKSVGDAVSRLATFGPPFGSLEIWRAHDQGADIEI